ncbi:MAG: hypothetical protein AAFR36_29060, partial [Bacteroidota bacterium]
AGNASGTANASGTTTGCSGGGGTPFTESYFFETGWDGWADGGSDCYRYSGSRSWEGNWSIRIRDNSGAASAMTSPSYDLAGLGSVEVSFYFYPNSMENGEDFWLMVALTAIATVEVVLGKATGLSAFAIIVVLLLL